MKIKQSICTMSRLFGASPIAFSILYKKNGLYVRWYIATKRELTASGLTMSICPRTIGTNLDKNRV